jgi:hypothetical protein
MVVSRPSGKRGQQVSKESANRSFDDLARGLAEGSISRRRALKLFAGTAIAALIPSRALAGGHGKPEKCDDPCICHRPPGNPQNAQTLCIPKKAREAHLKNHPSTPAVRAGGLRVRRRPRRRPRRLRLPLPLRRLLLPRPRLRRRLCAYRMAAPAPPTLSAVAELSAPTASVAPRMSGPITAFHAPATVSAAAVSAIHSALLAVPSARIAAALAAPALPANRAVSESLARTEPPVAPTLARAAPTTVTAVAVSPAVPPASPASADANCDSLPNGFPCTRSGLSAL